MYLVSAIMYKYRTICPHTLLSLYFYKVTKQVIKSAVANTVNCSSHVRISTSALLH